MPNERTFGLQRSAPATSTKQRVRAETYFVNGGGTGSPQLKNAKSKEPTSSKVLGSMSISESPMESRRYFSPNVGAPPEVSKVSVSRESMLGDGLATAAP